MDDPFSFYKLFVVEVEKRSKYDGMLDTNGMLNFDRLYYLDFDRDRIQKLLDFEYMTPRHQYFPMLHPSYWIEVNSFGFGVIFGETIAHLMMITFSKGELTVVQHLANKNVGGYNFETDGLDPDKVIMISIFFVLSKFIADRRNLPQTAVEVSKDRVEEWIWRGDHEKFTRVYQKTQHSVDSGIKRDTIIKKCRHPVRGFWRYFRKTNKRVWVKAHWRGNASLGTIRSKQEIVDPNPDN